jgi:predicted nucleotidyltransferase component of viral defense system
MIPLTLKIKKESHKKIAEAQDLIVSELYAVFNEAVLHGGTAIWRCYNGNRFSEDIDAYIPRDLEKINQLYLALEKKGFRLEKKKIGAHSIYSSLELNRVIVRFEALFKKVEGSLREYATIDGNLITVYTLTAEEFIAEKIAAYQSRRKIRDLYDIFFLMRYADSAKVQNLLSKFCAAYQPPLDEKEIKVLILEGLVPTAEKMMEYIRSHGNRKIP